MALTLDLRVITKGHPEVEHVVERSLDRDGGRNVSQYT